MSDRPAGWLLEGLGSVRSERTALCGPGWRVSYATLLRHVSSRSPVLDRIRPGDVVLARLSRSDPLTVAAALAVWARGGVPLLQDAGTATTLGVLQARLGHRWELYRAQAAAGVDEEPHCELLPGEWATLSEREPATQPVTTGYEDAAYLVLTSGSSGASRASLNRGTGLRNAVAGMIDRYAIDARTRTLQFAPPSYDAWIADVLPTLLAGGVVVLGPRGGWSRLAQLGETIERGQVTHFTAPPGVWRQLLGRVARLRTAISAGEALDLVTARRLAASADRAVNAYGPSEAAICTLTCELTVDLEAVTLGAPLPGVWVSVVADDQSSGQGGRPDSGLLRIHGAGVSLGYVGEQPAGASSAGKRVSSQSWFGSDERGRFFQSADLVRAEGSEIAFVARADRAVKRNGRLVDLERVESAVRALPGVSECVAIVRDTAIVCRYVPDKDGVEPDLRSLEGQLESWEQPALFESVEELARGSGDKLDRRSDVAHHPGPIAQGLRELWVQATGSSDPDISFFAAGGDSLAAMVLLDEVCERFAVEIDIADLIREPTLASMARLVREYSAQ